MTSFFLFDRWGKQLGIISEVVSANHVDELNGEDSLTIEFEDQEIIKGQRIVWRDKFGKWHEHTISDFTVYHADGRIYTNAYCENSISELLTQYVTWKKPSGTAGFVLTQALQGTRWTNGTVNVEGTIETNWYHISSYEALTDLVEKFGAELQTTISVSGAYVTERRVDILQRRGDDYGRRFTYGRNLVSIERKIEPGDVYTALYGYGKGLPVYDDNGQETGGYTNKLTFGEVNGGKDWISDEEARLHWGIPDGSGGVRHAFGQVEFDECEDPKELLKLTKDALEVLKHPFISYTASVFAFAQAGFANGEDVQTGDTVYIRDKDLDERLTGRVLKIERNLLDESSTSITLGNISGTLTDTLKKQQANLDWLKNRSAAWDGSTAADLDWLNHLIKNLNDQFDAVGNFQKAGFEIGMIWSTVPLDDNGKPLRTPAMAIQITGMGFRIASTVDSNGNFEWRTFGTGEGFTADCINAGIIRGGSNWWDLSIGDLQFSQGRIGDVDGYTYWDITNKAFRLVEENGHGIIYEDGKLLIDAEAVYIGSQDIETWTKAQIKVSADAITSTVGDLKTEVNSQITQTKDAIDIEINDLANKVTCTFTCNTPAQTAQKEATLNPADQNFIRKQGTIIAVTFTYANTAANPTLKAGDTTAANIVSGSTNLPTQMSWTAGSTVLFTWTGSKWQLTDSVAQGFINSHFKFDTNGLTVMGSSSDYKSRVGSGKFSILTPGNEEILAITAERVSSAKSEVKLQTTDFGTMSVGVGTGLCRINDWGFSFSSFTPGFDVNNIASVEVERKAVTSQSSCNVNLTVLPYEGSGSLEAVDIYYTHTDEFGAVGEARVVRANFYGKSSAHVTLTHQSNSVVGLYGYFEKIILTKNQGQIYITRTEPTKVFVADYCNFKTSPGSQFQINYIAICAYIYF